MVNCFKKLKTANMYAHYVPNFKNIMIKGERKTGRKSGKKKRRDW